MRKWNGGSSTWAGLPAAHLTSLLWDGLALVGMGLLGLRFGGRMLGAALSFAWAAYPFTQYVSNANSNDAIMPALLIWGLWLLTSPPARGVFLALAAWTKFAALLLLPQPAPVSRASLAARPYCCRRSSAARSPASRSGKKGMRRAGAASDEPAVSR